MTYLKPTLLIYLNIFIYLLTYLGFPGGSVVKNLPANVENAGPLGQEDPLGKEMATHSVFLPGESHGQRSLVGFSPKSSKESDMTEQLNSSSSYYYYQSYF